jgi:hypothetical protein
MAIYRDRKDFEKGPETKVELLQPAMELSIGIYALKDVPDCAIISGFVREVESKEDIETSPVNPNKPTILFAAPSEPPQETLPKGEPSPTTEPKGEVKK